MDKSDVVMKDAEKQPDDLLNNGHKSENKMVEKNSECEGRESTEELAVGDQQSSDVAEEHKIFPKAEDKDNTDYEMEDHIKVNSGSEENSKTADVGQVNVTIETGKKSPEQMHAGIKAGEQVNEMSETEYHENSNNEIRDRENIHHGAKEQNNSEHFDKNDNPGENGEEDKGSVESAAGKQAASESGKTSTDLQAPKVAPDEKTDEYTQVMDQSMSGIVHKTEDEVKAEKVEEPENESNLSTAVGNINTKLGEGSVTKTEVDHTLAADQCEPSTPMLMVKCSAGDASGETCKNLFYDEQMDEDDAGKAEDQAIFMKELEKFYRDRSMEFKPPKFYGQPLNCLKLWRSVIRLGGYDRVTGSKLWRQVGESFHPPKTCTTVSWTFRIFYEKALLEYERHKCQSGELQLPLVSEPAGVDSEMQANGFQSSAAGRARRDAAAKAMQGWHVQRDIGNGEVGEPIIKDKNLNSIPKREKNLKSIGSLKQKRPNEGEYSVKAARTDTSKRLVTTVADVGPPADWVKINVRETKDGFEVYALVPGLLREEVRVQSDPAGRLVITGQPEQPDNPWGITAFKKVISLPARIDPLHTTAVVSLHGRLFVRVPFEESNAQVGAI